MLNYTNKKIIAYACGAGAKIDGCKDAPEYLYKSDLAMLINARWRDIYHSVKKNNYDIIKKQFAYTGFKLDNLKCSLNE